MSSRVHWECAAALLFATAVTACNPENKYQPPPPPPVTISHPVREPVTDFLEITGQTSAFRTVDLTARVSGFLQSVNFQDGSIAKTGQLLFVIEPEPYQAKVDLANATVAQHQAVLKAAEANFERQAQLLKQNFASQANYDQALAQRDAERAAIYEANANLVLAKINLGYTHVTAPFDGRIGRHLVDPGNLVGLSSPTKLATIEQIDPIYAYFNVNERDVLRIRDMMRKRGVTLAKLGDVPVSAGLQSEVGYPHHGKLDFVDTGLDTFSGTIQVRAEFANADHVCCPGSSSGFAFRWGRPPLAYLFRTA